MKTQLILANFRKFPVHSHSTRDVNDILLAMFREQFGTRYDEDFVSLVPGNTLEVRRVYDIYVDESNFCRLDLLCVNDKPVALCGQHGHEDSADIEVTIVDNDSAFILAQQLSTALSQRRLDQYRKDLPETIPEDLFSLGGHEYLVALSDSTFGVKDRVDQNDLLKDPYSAWYRTPEGLERILDMAEWRDTDTGPRVYGKTEVGGVPLETERVIFQFMGALADRNATVDEMSASGDWMVCGKESTDAVPMAIVYIREPFAWMHAMHVITFGNKNLYRAFMQQHADAVDKLVPGAFPFETVPDDATMV